jgi:hypothetical protein
MFEDFLVLRAAVGVHDPEEKCLKCDPGRIRTTVYDTTDHVALATACLLEHHYATRQVTRNEVIRDRYAEGESLSALAREYALSPARIHQIVHREK